MSLRPTALSIALAIALPATTPLHAEELPVFIGDEIVVSPTRAPQKLSDSLAAMTVLTRKDIDASGAIDLPTLLQGQAGVEIAQTGGFGQASAIRLRGAESDHTLVLVDGLRMNSVSSGTTAIEHLPLDEIARIEIVRGNVSSVYGSEAIGGVVRIFTRQGKGEMKPRVEIAAGTDNFSKIHASIGGELKPGLSLHFGAGHTQSGGFSAVKKHYATDNLAVDPFNSYLPADADDDKSRNTHFNLRLAHQINERLSWGLSTLQSRADVDYDGRFSNHAKQNLAGYSLFFEGQPTDLWNAKLTLARSTDELDNDLNGLFSTGRYLTSINQLHWENTLLMGHHTFRFGAEAQDQKLDSDQIYSQVERRSASAYAGAGFKFGDHGIDLSLRHDHYSDFGGHTTGRLAYGYAISPALKFHTVAGTAFKAPTFNDLYLDFPPDFFSNPSLKPERAKNVELGLTYSVGSQFIQAVLFASRTNDMIGFVPAIYDAGWNLLVPGTTTNIDQAQNHGLELTWNGKLASMDARAALTLQNPEDANTGQSLLRRAQRFGSFALSDKIGKFGWRAEVIASGSHPDVHVTSFARTSVPGYANLNLSGDYMLAKDWKLTGRIINALDAGYSLVHGYATPGRNFRLELAYSPK